ncbi:hypothetical protein COK00_26325 [Bacillus cereus]|uniref:Uncharacterized protein n=1 Tax=Bacillus cereus TaxID=1396 RepID=A0A2A8Y277_BACCE|nr:hypothetical protein BK728_10760 [Bacillus thuringiensis serovar chanpaisis]PEC86454.1 hypothetical protein CON28_06185 [Bacillus cereus]PNK31489.1 hypothetical protein CBR56_07760 [Bacillus thuringiensis]PEQ52144.1 hypothetical protein CN468_05375 [Bacillus cereus]PEX37762.1 hypothetical protein CN455_15285 [Bacillus cereus]
MANLDIKHRNLLSYINLVRYTNGHSIQQLDHLDE